MTTTQKETSPKLRIVALLLCWFVGLFGAHRFYVGKTGSAVLMLLISFTFVGMFVTGIWLLVDLIMIATGTFEDVGGRVLTKWND